MAKFCVYCGAPLEETSGRCPLCEREQPDLSEPKPMVWPKVKSANRPEPAQQESFPHAQEWLSQESPVWQEETQKETKEPLQPVKSEQQEEQPQKKAQESPERQASKKRDDEAQQALSSEPINAQQAQKDVVQKNDFSAAAEEEKRPLQDQAAQKEESDEARQREYENTFSEMLQDFSKEQEQNAAPPQPKYLPAATYEEQPEPTTAGILGTLVLSVIPIVGWILLLVWAFDGQAAVLQKKLARALLLFKLIVWLILLIAGGLTFYLSYEITQMNAYSAFSFSGMT